VSLLTAWLPTFAFLPEPRFLNERLFAAEIAFGFSRPPDLAIVCLFSLE